MPKMMIEVEIPNGRSVAEAQGAVKRAFDPDWMAEWWCVDDVIEQHDTTFCGEITTEEARLVLQMMKKRHDCSHGHTWDSMDHWIDHVKAQRKEVA
jgi:hypothetical protein